MAGAISLAMTLLNGSGPGWLAAWIESYALAFAIAYPLSLVPLISRLSGQIPDLIHRPR